MLKMVLSRSISRSLVSPLKPVDHLGQNLRQVFSECHPSLDVHAPMFGSKMGTSLVQRGGWNERSEGEIEMGWKGKEGNSPKLKSPFLLAFFYLPFLLVLITDM